MVPQQTLDRDEHKDACAGTNAGQRPEQWRDNASSSTKKRAAPSSESGAVERLKYERGTTAHPWQLCYEPNPQVCNATREAACMDVESLSGRSETEKSIFPQPSEIECTECTQKQSCCTISYSVDTAPCFANHLSSIQFSLL
jgi:hypothetical protein